MRSARGGRARTPGGGLGRGEAEDAGRGTRGPSGERAAVAVVAAISTPDAAAAFGALVRIASRGTTAITSAAWSDEAGLPHNDEVRLMRAIVEAEDAGIRLVDGPRTSGRPRDRPDSGEGPPEMHMCEAFLALLREPERFAADPSAAGLDARSAAWIPVLASAARRDHVGDVGLHVALRIARGGERAVLDLASGLADAGAAVLVPRCRRDLARAIVHAELHGGEPACVVVMADARLMEGDEATDLDRDAPAAPETLRPTPEAGTLLPAFAATRNVYVWPIPATGTLPEEASRAIGAEIGPVSFDRGWVVRTLADRLPGLGSGGTTALIRRHPDPRSAEATLAVIRAAVCAGLGPAEACALVLDAKPSEEDAPSPVADFDERLLVCRPEALVLLRAGAEALSRGGRVLAWGAPGVGKSSYALALATRLGTGSDGTPGRPAIALSPARFLARAWGATERLLRDLWARAEREGATLVADEFGSLCPARGGGTGGNSYLVRSLTDEMLRAMDAHPDVPLVATVNDPGSIDPAALRRFTFVLEFGAGLSPDQERLAWRRLLGMDPPPGWRPIGAAVADFPIAAKRCRALGQADAAAHAEALRQASAARGGPLRRNPGKALH